MALNANFVLAGMKEMDLATQQGNKFVIDGELVNVELSQVIAEAIYIKRIFRDGQSVTFKYVTNPKEKGAVRVDLETPYEPAGRTLAFGGREGTPGNAGIINKNPPLLPGDKEFFVYLNHVDDQMLAFPDLQKNYLPLEIMARKVASYANGVAEERDGTQLAEILAYNIYRAMNGGNNIVSSANVSSDNGYADLFNDIGALLDNGDHVTGAHTYGTEGRTIIGRPTFVRHAVSVKSGLIVNGGDLAQTMLRDYKLGSGVVDKDYVGDLYLGKAGGFHIQSCADYIWSMAEAMLGLAPGALDNVDAIATHYDANAASDGIDLGAKFVDATTFRGTLAQPLNIWGNESFRKSYIIAKAAFDTTYLAGLGFTESTRLYPIIPNKVKNPTGDIVEAIYGEDGVTITGYRVIKSIQTPNGGNMQSGLPHCAKPTESSFTSNTLKLATATTGADIYYTTDGTAPIVDANKKYTSSGISISGTKTVRAIAVKSGYVWSEEFSGTYTAS